MVKQKKLNKLKVSIVIVLIVMVFAISVFGRYIYNGVREAYFQSRKFYFSSDILTANGSEFQYTNWSGTDVYPIEIELRSYNNKLSEQNSQYEDSVDYDLEYSVSCEPSSTADAEKVTCTLNSYGEGATDEVTGTIPSSTNTSKVVLYVTPLRQIETDEMVSVTVTATTQSPYQKTISCKFTLTPEVRAGISYEIEDSVGSEYALLKIKNTADSAVALTLEFDPDELRIDSNDEIYVNKTNEVVDGNGNVKQISFRIEKEYTKYVRFYKVDKSQNYTYTGLAGTSAITLTAD